MDGRDLWGPLTGLGSRVARECKEQSDPNMGGK